MTTSELRSKISEQPREKLAFLPTPLQEMPRMTKALGGSRIFFKRDDQTGLALGGNKTRMFEFLLAKAIQAGADTIIGGAAIQSNYCRQLAAACNVLGLEVHLCLGRETGELDETIQGNLLLDLVAGANVHILDVPMEQLAGPMYKLADKLKSQGKKPYVVRIANDKDLSPDVISYAECFCEIVEQSQEFNIKPTHLYVASFDSTQAGLELGKMALESDMAIRGVATRTLAVDLPELIARYANQAAETLGINCRTAADRVYNTQDYIGTGYGVCTDAESDLIKWVARTEGVFMDPVYTIKALAAMIDHIKKGELTREDTVIFLHTGGGPSLFAYNERLGTEELKSHLTYGI
jgi:1-aminocyclopropane-1-carboxylate deaminase/D-cysteine desulfhydrase-like pyridoxal-dependent ACC family enzyme